ncbi:MAG: acyl carrier protein [Acutalibacteraceae bacterium]|nr:acyl carrier protein [Acutalibacteraceae bacterium]
MDKNQIIAYMKELMAEAMDCEVDDVDENASFFKLGISSIKALKIINMLRKKLNVEISPVAMFEYKCVNDLAEYLYQCSQEQSN